MATPALGGFVVGSHAELQRLISADDVKRFAELTGDDNPLHVDSAFAEKTTYKAPVAHGMLTASFISTIIGKHLPGSGALWLSQSLQFLMPVRTGDTIRVRAEVKAVHVSRQVLTLGIEVVNQHGQRVLSGEAKVRVLGSAPTEAASEAEPVRREETCVVKHSNPVAIVTGASRGIGAETARRLARDGFAVVVDYRNDEAGARAVVADIEAAKGRAVATRADVRCQEDLRELVRVAMSHFGGVSAVVNNASDAMVYKPLSDVTIDDLTQQMELHVYAAFRLVREAMPYLECAANPAVVSVGSIAADGAPPSHAAAYTAAKAALASLTKSFAVEYGPKGIRFNIVAPGMADTAMIANTPEKAKMLARMQSPLRRLADPSDVAEGVAYLLSPKARHITGETLRICGGASML